MRPILLKTLKILALQGGTRHSVHISSTELAKKLEISQQSASRHIINLEKKDYIQKKYAQGGQIVNINDKGLAVLRKEFTEYGLIFGTEKNVEMVGTLETGLGEGGYYISKEGYMKQFDKLMNNASNDINKLDFGCSSHVLSSIIIRSVFNLMPSQGHSQHSLIQV